MKTNYSQVLSC